MYRSPLLPVQVSSAHYSPNTTPSPKLTPTPLVDSTSSSKPTGPHAQRPETQNSLPSQDQAPHHTTHLRCHYHFKSRHRCTRNSPEEGLREGPEMAGG
ncbi:hypothetical protein BDZ91DRAFT_726588, partial [Kalaharituber pfeilii]